MRIEVEIDVGDLDLDEFETLKLLDELTRREVCNPRDRALIKEWLDVNPFQPQTIEEEQKIEFLQEHWRDIKLEEFEKLVK